jgi:DNA-binding transcriptional ArsR family regulator
MSDDFFSGKSSDKHMLGFDASGTGALSGDRPRAQGARFNSTPRVAKMPANHSSALDEQVDVLLAAIRVAASRDDDASFASVLDTLLRTRRIITAGDIADALGVAGSTVGRWRDAKFAPREFMRRAVLAAVSKLLRAKGGSRQAGSRTLGVLSESADLGVETRKLMLAVVRRRIASAAAKEDETEFAATLRATLDFVPPEILSEEIGYSQSTLSRWASCESRGPRLSVRQAVLRSIETILDRGLGAPAGRVIALGE